jgi:hypothetical protein
MTNAQHHFENGLRSFYRTYAPTGLDVVLRAYSYALVGVHLVPMLFASGFKVSELVCKVSELVIDQFAKNKLANQQPSQNSWKAWFHDNGNCFANIAKENLRNDMIKVGTAFMARASACMRWQCN